jgi:ferredoxin-type protein NapH
MSSSENVLAGAEAIPERTEKAATRLNTIRRCVQLAAVGVLGQWSFYGIFRCPFIVPYVSCQNCPVITCHGRLLTLFWGFWLILPVSVLFFGRAFCGWACPGGMVNQLLGKLAPLKLRVRNLFTRFAPWGLALGLAASVYAYFAWNQFRGNIPIRAGEFFNSVALTFEHAGTLWLIRTFFVLAFLGLGLVAANAWCRFACPTGGVLEALKHLSIFRLYKTDRCNDCDNCLKVCEMGTRPSEANCTNCGDCLHECPSGAIRFGRKKSS